MIPVTQKPGADPRSVVARPKTGETPVRTLRIPNPDWPDFHKVTGRRLATVVHQFIRWYLRRPGAKLPERPSVEEITRLTNNPES